MSGQGAGSRGSWERVKEGPSPERAGGKKTPETGSVRRSYVAARLRMVWAVEDAEGEFDRWLAEFERSVAEKAWDQGWDLRDEGTREVDIDSEYHFDRRNNPHSVSSRWED